jgi:hypothetical protein
MTEAIPPPEVTQMLVLWLWYYDSGTDAQLDLLATKAPPRNIRSQHMY